MCQSTPTWVSALNDTYITLLLLGGEKDGNDMTNPVDKLVIDSYRQFTPQWQKRVDRSYKHIYTSTSNSINRFLYRVEVRTPIHFWIAIGRIRTEFVIASTGEVRRLARSRIWINPATQDISYDQLCELLWDMYGGIDDLYIRRYDVKLDDPAHDVGYYSQRLLMDRKRSYKEFVEDDEELEIPIDLHPPLQTVRIGSRQDQLQIYDKRQQLLAINKTDLGYPLTRLEHIRCYPIEAVPFCSLPKLRMFDNVSVYDTARDLGRESYQALRNRLDQGDTLFSALRTREFSRSTMQRLRKDLFDADATRALRYMVARLLMDYYDTSRALVL